MADSGFVVTLYPNMLVEDSKAIQEAIERLRGVVSVDPLPEDMVLLMARRQVKQEFSRLIWSQPLGQVLQILRGWDGQVEHKEETNGL